MIIIMGSVGSGKSEQSTRLANRLKLPRISTSKLLRDHLTPQREAKMKAGDLVDDSEVIELLEPELKKIEADKKEFLLDGFPRSVPQASWLVTQIKSGKIKLTAVIKLNVAEQTVLGRMLKRGRDDDQEEIIRHRLDAYSQITTPVVAYLRSIPIEVYEINGERSANEVEAEITSVLESRSQ